MQVPIAARRDFRFPQLNRPGFRCRQASAASAQAANHVAEGDARGIAAAAGVAESEEHGVKWCFHAGEDAAGEDQPVDADRSLILPDVGRPAPGWCRVRRGRARPRSGWKSPQEARRMAADGRGMPSAHRKRRAARKSIDEVRCTWRIPHSLERSAAVPETWERTDSRRVRPMEPLNMSAREVRRLAQRFPCGRSSRLRSTESTISTQRGLTLSALE